VTQSSSVPSSESEEIVAKFHNHYIENARAQLEASNKISSLLARISELNNELTQSKNSASLLESRISLFEQNQIQLEATYKQNLDNSQKSILETITNLQNKIMEMQTKNQELNNNNLDLNLKLNDAKKLMELHKSINNESFLNNVSFNNNLLDSISMQSSMANNDLISTKVFDELHTRYVELSNTYNSTRKLCSSQEVELFSVKRENGIRK